MLGDAVHVCCSWLGKIQTVKELLVDNAERSRPGLDALAYAYIYLQVTLPDQRLLHTHLLLSSKLILDPCISRAMGFLVCQLTCYVTGKCRTSRTTPIWAGLTGMSFCAVSLLRCYHFSLTFALSTFLHHCVGWQLVRSGSPAHVLRYSTCASFKELYAVWTPNNPL